ncbi:MULTISPECIES: acyl-CoA dehydrogenase family protein [Gordonia]|uniref:Acyl-CoA dehydrogenase/oxidase C-terminal domain-containing protein n=1 Tax=Gordonia alkanivorans NBRC 16433 TaxID=1027371 RepID=F9VPM1_9ACTN|nr:MULTISPECIES: acyl-CoA dehydrogenase family protein [Gordonia]MDH3008429.1 acyl-CoA dehydrogenase family protein [Gordonia alkanivorans]MDH3015641.1 acyl-CoA dehydrogenase family protein [Gordonia alkanivorans]MDH3020375.1 acyl-CoA dehydrogenase family protein [Gordonia alkanivorans]MDH3040211.1 acyl-CoA dehydrogenase family protein [Gordonia alkanivorans]MDH3048989.1 acyl-CoA dehydrogenase family protein [Gordonia alkanivorans]
MDDDDISQIREALLQTVDADPAAAREAVTEFGWDELLADQEDIAVATLLPIWGRSLAHGSLLTPVMLCAGGVDSPTTTRIVLPRISSSVVPGRYDGERVVVDGVLSAGDGPILVPAASDGDIVFAVCETPELPTGDPLDPTAGWTRLTGTFTVTEQLSPSGHTPSQAWPLMVAAGRRALTYELLGASRAMLDMTVEHVTSRQQFGQALGSFQAVKHQLADVHLWIEVAQLAADAAWEDRGEASAALAKAAGTRASATARKVCQQLLGGMGFTWEHDFHRYLRRALTLEPLLGGSVDLHRELGAALRVGSVSPALAPL